MNILNIESMSRDDIGTVLELAAYHKTEWGNRRFDQPAMSRAAFIWNQPTTRTRAAFELAAGYLDMDVTTHVEPISSMAKGETLPDMVAVLGQMVDVVVVRDVLAGVVGSFCECPVVNAGDSDDHPTQALVDLWSLKQRHMLNEDHTFAVAWAKEGVPRAMKSFHEGARKFGMRPVNFSDHPDVLYVTRDSDPEFLEEALNCSRVILHPGPWCGEVPESILRRGEWFLGWEQAAQSPMIKAAILQVAMNR